MYMVEVNFLPVATVVVLNLQHMKLVKPFYTTCYCVQGRTKGGEGVGLKSPLEFDILQILFYLRKEINCFRISFAC